ncbi:MAG TPA: SRPBCC domain-containing protein [Leptospiraceae bacterium]|nr:hypothetical protein [Spirochaetaceae bacterium]HBS06977.1 SRPBCC domain-containing protein [Leptospiraceae bacterium]|tara:strand:+ start:41434 stop:41862 length:429 start_codon:yes stop_codon:yes gene_type:complete
MNENDVVVRKTIEMNREQVFQAWLDTASMAKWFCPIPGGRSEVQCDASVGGQFKIDMIAPDGDTVPHWGIYKTIDPHELLEFTWNSPNASDTVVRIEFKAVNDGTELTLIHSGLDTEKGRNGHRDGWTSILERLSESLVAVG